MNYGNKESSRELLEEIILMLDELIVAHQLFISLYNHKSTNPKIEVQTQLKNLKGHISKQLKLITHGDMKGFSEDIVIPALCTANYLLTKIGANRINHNSYLSVKRELLIVQYYIKKHYLILLDK